MVWYSVTAILVLDINSRGYLRIERIERMIMSGEFQRMGRKWSWPISGH